MLITRKMLIKTTRYYFMPIRVTTVKTKDKTITNKSPPMSWQEQAGRRWKPCALLLWMKTGSVAAETVWWFLTVKNNHHMI